MTKYEQLTNMLSKGDGYLNTADVTASGISRTYLATFVRENNLEKAANGVYVLPDIFPDELYILQKAYPSVVYSGETALYLHELIDKEYSKIYVTAPSGFNGSRLRERNISVHQEKEEMYKLGIEEVATNLGHMVRTYNKERCICDLIKNREKIDIQNYQTALKTYMNSKSKNLSLLINYAQVLKLQDEIMKYIEVLT